MSKLSDLIRRTTGADPAPLGFALGERKTKPTMLLVAIASKNPAREAADAAGAGADIVLLTGAPSEKEVQEAVSSAKDAAIGLMLDGSGKLKDIQQAGADFVVLQPDTPASVLLNEKLGFVFRVSDDLTDMQLRMLDALPVNAMYVEQNAAPLTIQRQLELRRVSGLTRKPLLLPVPSDADQDHLLALREAGVALLAVDMSVGGASALGSLRKLVDGLPKQNPHHEKTSVTLPLSSSRPIENEEEHEHEED